MRDRSPMKLPTLLSQGDDDSTAKSSRRKTTPCFLGVQLACRRAHRVGALALAIMVLLAGSFVVALTYYVPRALSEHFQLVRALEEFEHLRLPPDTIPILIPVYSRPQYLIRVLGSLQRASNIGKTVLIFSQDGQFDSISSLIAGVNFTAVIHMRHSPPWWGLPSVFLKTDAPTAANVYFLLRFAMEWLRVPGAIVLESDIEVSPDALDYFRWALERSAAHPRLAGRVFTVNGYYERSAAGNDPFTVSTGDYGFMVWGWLCPRSSWPLIRGGWTWFANWDITLEHAVRRPSGLVSLSPLVSRTRNIGMQGINFAVSDPAEIARWHSLYVPPAAIDFRDREMVVVDAR